MFHVDVFATQPLTGNGLTVFLSSTGWTSSHMLDLTREMKQFESIFLTDVSSTGASARIFTVEEELPFAGHPILGAAVVLHRTQTPEANESLWRIRVQSGELSVSTRRMSGYHLAEMNQGPAQWGISLGLAQVVPLLKRLGLTIKDVQEGMNAQVVSTGLPYLIVPVTTRALGKVKIQGTDLEEVLATIGAKFLVVLDVHSREIRTWDNLGNVEDVATGSAAGPVAAYLFKYANVDPSLALRISQGRFVGRDSKICVTQDSYDSLLVSGEVWPVSNGTLEICNNRTDAKLRFNESNESELRTYDGALMTPTD